MALVVGCAIQVVVTKNDDPSSTKKGCQNVKMSKCPVGRYRGSVWMAKTFLPFSLCKPDPQAPQAHQFRAQP
jgi:hypothetical protein